MRSGEEMERDERYDSMIDRALRSYGEPAEVPETRVVLARVMERVRASESQRRGWWMWGAVAAAGLTVMVLVGVVWMTRSSRGPEIAWVPKAPGVMGVPHRPTGKPSGEGDGTRSVEQVGRQAISAENAGAKARSDIRSVSARLKSCPDTRTCWDGAPHVLPKKEVFPTPRPLTEEEQALVAFARRAPPAVKKAVIEDQQHWDDPVIVADLRKPPVESSSQQHQ